LNLFKKLFNKKESPELDQEPKAVNLSLDDNFVKQFIEKGGKFIYCTSKEEVLQNLYNIVKENNWEVVTCFEDNLLSFAMRINLNTQLEFNNSVPFFTTCEHLISDKGEILFSSNQISTYRLQTLTDDFIVYASTSQFVNNTSMGLTGIKSKWKQSIPTNISSVKGYSLTNNSDDFLNYGNNNTKNLYLLLFEDL